MFYSIEDLAVYKTQAANLFSCFLFHHETTQILYDLSFAQNVILQFKYVNFIYSFYIFSIHGYILNSQVTSSQLANDSSVGKSSAPVSQRSWVQIRSSLNPFFRLYVLNCLSWVNDCNDLSFAWNFIPQFKYMNFIYSLPILMFLLWGSTDGIGGAGGGGCIGIF